jgi:formylglycine-generating enzyme required for sulfatase activity
VAVSKRYESFDLLIQRGRRSGEGHRYSVQLIASPAGEAPASSVSFSDSNLRASLLGSGETAWRDLAPRTPAGKTAEEIGSELFRALISGDVQRCWDTSLEQVRQEGRGLRLRLWLSDAPGVEDLPWELVYDPAHRQFLSLAEDLAVVRYLKNQTRPSFEKVRPPIRVLVLIANPKATSPLDGEQEWELLNRALESSIGKGKVQIERLEPPTLPALERAMRKPWHVVHFVGHGRFDADEGGLLLEDAAGRPRTVSGRKLKVVLGSPKQLRLVVLNSCQGARTSPGNAFAGVAQSLVGAGVPAVVAMRCRVSDPAALLFADRFYTALAEGQAVDASLGEARRAMHADADTLEWSTPVLYLRSPDGSIFDFLAPFPASARNWPRLSRWAGAALGAAAALGGAYWVSTFPNLSTDPDCPSPPGLAIPFVKIRPGRFLMGEKKGKPVEITHPFCLGKFEVTQAAWKQVMGTLTHQRRDGASLPVGNVSWNETKEFCRRLGAKDPAALYRLPTEAQWEYAARAGTSNRFSFDGETAALPAYGNCSKASVPVRVGSLQPNPWGLYDMYGNVSEWVEDWEGELPDGRAVDPTGPENGTKKVRRGGSFDYGIHCDSVYRRASLPERRSPGFGFRIVRDPIKPAS